MSAWKVLKEGSLVKLISISGSPTEGSSTDILLHEIAASVSSAMDSVESAHIRLNDLTFIPCQACGKAPAPEFCFYDDDLSAVYSQLAACDCLLFGSPIFFDSVSAQAKAFMDRCNCMRPPDYDNIDPVRNFLTLIPRKRPGAIVLVGGEQGWFEGARRSIAGFFKWVEVINEGHVFYRSQDFRAKGTVRDDPETLAQAHLLGRRLADCLRVAHDT